jgi:hypothetical protein
MEPVAAAWMPAADHPASPTGSAGAHPLAADPQPQQELARLRNRVEHQARTLAVMAAAISALRDGSRAVREENRELRLELQATRSSPNRPKLPTGDRQQQPAAMAT